MITCILGPLEKDESVLFKVRSRLFRETVVKVCSTKHQPTNNVKHLFWKDTENSFGVSSKLVMRAAKLPFSVDDATLDFQVWYLKERRRINYMVCCHSECDHLRYGL